MQCRLPFLVPLVAVGSYAVAGGAEEANDESLTLTVAAEAPAGSQKLVTLDLSGRLLAKLLEEPSGLSSPCWSDDDRQLIFISARSGKPQIQTALTQTANEEYHPCCRPDGKQVAFASGRTGNIEVFVMDTDGSRQTNLTNSPSWDTEPAWSPDGAQIVFSDRVADGSWQIFVANADGQAVEQLTEGGGTNSYASWSPDGRYIAYLHFEQPMTQNPGFARLMLFDTESATHTQLGPDDLKCNGALRAWKRDTK